MDSIRHPSPNTFFRVGFTLIELLTVIAIIGILAAIIIPVTGRVRESAKNTRCVSNLKGLGTAFMLFAADNNNRFPADHSNESGEAARWWYRISPYLGVPEPTPLPSDGSFTNKLLSKPGGPLGCMTTSLRDNGNYYWSYKMTGAHRVFLGSGNVEHMRIGLPVSAIGAPAQSLLVAEGREHTTFYNCDVEDETTGMCYPHRDKLNALFADGHVRSFIKGELKKQWDTFYTHAVN